MISQSIVSCLCISLVSSMPTLQTAAQVPGCRDPQASNYDAAATTNDGSCTYNTTTYTPAIKANPMNTLVEETSGLQWADGHLWTLNDGGNTPALYRIDTVSSTIFQTVNFAGITNVDWEDLGFDGAYFYLGDFGNNLNGARTDLKIYKFPLSAIPDYTTDPVVTVPLTAIETISFTYSNQSQPPVPTAANATMFDCEAMLVDGNKIHLFSKNWIGNNTTHYVINGTSAGTYIADSVETLNIGYLVTAADKAVGENIIALLGYQASGTANHFMHLLSDYGSNLYFDGNKRRIDLPNVLTMGQAEGISFRNATYGYISNERFSTVVGGFPINVSQKLFSFNTASFVSQYLLPLDLRNFEVINRNGIHKLNWKFTEPVKQLELQYSDNGSRFTKAATYSNISQGEYSTASKSAVNYYRLAWKRSLEGETVYSKTVVLKQETGSLSNFHLNYNGDLAFTNNGQPDRYSVKVATTEGKVLATLPDTYFRTGRNAISFPQVSLWPKVVCVMATNKTETISKLLWLK